jgi:hypothetical protein
MSVLAKKYNLLNLVKQTDPDGHIASIVELLSLQNPILKYMPFVKAPRLLAWHQPGHAPDQEHDQQCPGRAGHL